MNVVLFFLLNFIWITDAYAYLNPGTGSMMIQSLIAVITGGLFMFKIYWQRLKDKLSSRKKNKLDQKACCDQNHDESL
jgi:hypothetical protein